MNVYLSNLLMHKRLGGQGRHCLIELLVRNKTITKTNPDVSLPEHFSVNHNLI